MKNAVFVVGLLFVAVAWGMLNPNTSLAQVPPDGWAHCKVQEIAVFNNRAHVLCAGPAKGSGESTIFGNALFYFAVSNSDQAWMKNFLDIANAAFLSGRTFHAQISATATAPCGPGDGCRVAAAFMYR